MFGLEESEMDAPMVNVSQSPNEYIAAGIAPKTFSEWRNAGGFELEPLQELLAAGYKTDDLGDLGERVHVERGQYEATVAYAYSNGDISLDEIPQYLEQR
jgi:hypothetical protein